jgi:hypothetical protein
MMICDSLLRANDAHHCFRKVHMLLVSGVMNVRIFCLMNHVR